MSDIVPALIDGSPPAEPDTLLRRLDELGLEVATISHPPVFTVEEARARREGMAGAFTKNLFVRDKKGVMWLIVAIE